MKIQGWEKILHESVKKHGDFKYGSTDCANFAFNVMADITGIDYKPWKNVYRSEKGAVKHLRKTLGFKNVEEAMNAFMKQEMQDIRFAKRGDIVMHESEEYGAFGGALGVCLGDQSAFSSEGGFRLGATLECKGFWRVE